jgi:acetoin utilization protein AcuB
MLVSVTIERSTATEAEFDGVIMNKKLNITIEEVMEPFPHTIGSEQTLKTAREFMTQYNIRHLPVQSGGNFLGIITERDILFALASDLKTEESILVKDAFTEGAYAVEPDTALSEVAKQMADEHIGCALILRNEKLVGIFTTVDACRQLQRLLS